MDASKIVRALSQVVLPSVFNPYCQVCPTHDIKSAASCRRGNLRSYLSAFQESGVDTMWMGRDLGYRGGRRTGLAFTDEAHLARVCSVYSGANANKATRTPAVAERTASEVWRIISSLKDPPLLWNVFPLHPHEAEHSFTNRKFSSSELKRVDDINAELFAWLNIRRIVAVGVDATRYSARFGLKIFPVRHPSYGGLVQFRKDMRVIYPPRSVIR
ncbi:hypothetical protein ABIC90_004897 [Variovorax boronicumulans]